MTSPVDTAEVAIVPDFSRFAAELRRGVETALRNVANDIDRAFESVERAASEAGEDIGREFQQGGETAERALSELSRASRREFSQIERQASVASAGIATKLGGAVALLRTGLITLGVAAGAGLVAITTMGLKAAASLEQTQTSFEALLGSAEVGRRVFKELQQFAAVTPFEFPELVGTAQRFFTFAESTGIAKENVKEFLTILGNVSSVLGAGAFGMERVALAMAQITSAGRLQGDELLQISDALPGFNARLAIANFLGISLAEMVKRQEAGMIDARTAILGLIDGMKKFPGAAGAMEKQAQSLLGVFSTLKDTLSQALVAGFTPVLPQIKESMLEITPVLEEAIAGIAPILGQALTAILPFVAELVKMITPILGPIVQGLGEALKAFGPSLAPLGEAIGKVVKALGPLFPIIGKIFGVLADALTPIFEALAPVVEALAPVLGDLVMAFLPLIPSLGELVAALLPVLLPLTKLLALLVGLLANKAVAPLIQGLAIVIGFLAQAVAEFGKWLDTINWAEVGRAIGGFFADAWRAVLDFFKGIGKFFSELPGKVRSDFQAMHDAIVNRVAEMIAFVKSLPGRVVAAIGNFALLLVEKGKDLIRGLWNGIKQMGGWLFQKVKDFAYANTVGAIKTALGIGSPSTVMAQDVGRWIPPGIGMGVESALPELRALLSSAGAALPAATTAGGGGGMVFGPGSIVVQFAGVVPTAGEARRTGEQVAAGIQAGLIRRDVRTAGRTR